MRAYVKTNKKNFLYKYTYLIPGFVLHDRKNEEGVIERIITPKEVKTKDHAAQIL